jgi:RimJ/RimL family protein N-acetyltransferase
MPETGSRTVLKDATDAHFAWMLGEAESADGLTLPPGGVDDDATITLLRDTARKLLACRGCLSWLIVSGHEVVGLCGFKDAPRGGAGEIGYGVAASRRNLGHASRAVREILTAVSGDSTIQTLLAETSVSNFASQRVLERNGFEVVGRRADPDDGELVLWRRAVNL